MVNVLAVEPNIYSCMKYIAIAYLIIACSACRYSTCEEPSISLKFNGQMLYNHFALNRYEKGSNFTNLISTDTDAVTVSNGKYAGKKYNTLYAGCDYIIEIVGWNKQYKISDINYSGKTKAKDDGLVSENKTRCTRDINYTVNGDEKHIQGSVYSYGNTPYNKAEILIEL